MNTPLRWTRFSVGLAAIILLACSLESLAQPSGAGAGQHDTSITAIKRSMEQRLNEQRARIRKIAEPVLERIRKMRGREPAFDVQTQSIKVQGADADYQNAKLSREVAEIDVKEYEEGIYVQDRATAEGELHLAEVDVKRSAEFLKGSQAMLEQIKRISTGKVYDLVAQSDIEARVRSYELSNKKAELELESARAKLQLLKEWTKLGRSKDLRAKVEKARSDELMKEQTLELEQSKLARMKKQAEGFKMPEKYQPILSLLADAVRLDGEIHDKLAKLDAKDDNLQSAPRQEIEEQARSLEAKVNEARRLWEDLKFAELASEINFACSIPAAVKPAISRPISKQLMEKLSKLSPDDRSRLKNATEEERAKILKQAGFSDEELKQMQQMRERMREGR